MKARKFKIKIQGIEDWKRDTIDEWRAVEKGRHWESGFDAVIGIPDASWLSKIFSPERVRIITTVKEKKPQSIAELARMLKRPQPAVQKDVGELARLGVLELDRKQVKGQKREVVIPRYEWDAFEITV